VSTVQPTVTNISTYLFAPLENLKGLRDHLRQVCRDWSLKGTILLSTEGINLFVAGPAERIDQLVTLLRAVPGLGGLTPKISLSEEQPFSRMLVKIKKEIISFGVEGIDPVNKPAPATTTRSTWARSRAPSPLACAPSAISRPPPPAFNHYQRISPSSLFAPAASAVRRRPPT
jgi:predicted sulfurtransferase